jgi:hypothetical protein
MGGLLKKGFGLLKGLAPIAGPIIGGALGGPAGAAAGGAIGGLLGGAGRGAGRPAEGAANFANAFLQEIPGRAHEQLDPFINQGRGADEILNNEYARLLQNRPEYSRMGEDPTGYLNELLGQYQPSAGYQYRKNNLLQGAGATAAAGGFRGTKGDVRNQSELVNALMSGDIQEYLQNVLGIQKYGQEAMERQHAAGLGGYQNMAGRGFEAAGSLADILGGNLGQQAGLQFAGRQQGNADIQAQRNMAGGQAADILGMVLGRQGTQQGGAPINGVIPGQVPQQQQWNPLSNINFGGGPRANAGNVFNANRGGYGAQGGRVYGAG